MHEKWSSAGLTLCVCAIGVSTCEQAASRAIGGRGFRCCWRLLAARRHAQEFAVPPT
jgi:hypothetical protein